jgi:hypothetical protein
MRAVLDRGGDRSAVLQRFVSGLGPDDEQILRAALHEHRPGSTRRTRPGGGHAQRP